MTLTSLPCARRTTQTNMPPLCECGCGEVPNIINHSVKKRGRKRGEYNRFCPGHSSKYAYQFRAFIHGLCVGTIDKRYYMWKGSKRRAKQAGVPWDLRIEDIPSIPDICPVLGITIDCKSPARCANSPSLDRVIPELGYIASNIRIISWRANDLKKDASLKELESIVNYIRESIVK